MVHFDSPGRPRTAEDEYFWRQDAEILARAGEALRIRVERAALADALGAHDLDAIDQLYSHGLRASTAAVVEWLPAVEVAWLDGMDEAERHALRVQFSSDDRASGAGLALLHGWLTQRPPHRLFAAGRSVLRDRLHALDDEGRGAALARIVAICEAAGRAAGGLFGLGALSSDERRHIELIRRDLAPPL